ncbi:MAG: ABC transporter permease [Patescibacteria group bacterium]|nr:ABC transporter permease [Patescibacteria group bacterium]MDE1946067.1 ABC transporter permease [Patescibacteria group bacterium]
MRTIYILWLRQIKRYLRSKSRVFGSLAQPLLFLVALGYGLGPVFQKAGEGNYVQFLVPGVIGMAIIFSSVFSGIEIIWDKQFGFLKETLVAPVSRVEIMLGRTAGGATTSTMQGIIVFLIATLIGFRAPSALSVGLAVILMFLIALLFTALGTIIASQLDDMQGFQFVVNFLVMPLFFLSGALFPLSGLPSALAALTRIDPLSYGIDAFRTALGGAPVFGLGLDLSVLIVLTAALVAIGSWLFSKIQI